MKENNKDKDVGGGIIGLNKVGSNFHQTMGSGS